MEVGLGIEWSIEENSNDIRLQLHRIKAFLYSFTQNIAHSYTDLTNSLFRFAIMDCCSLVFTAF